MFDLSIWILTHKNSNWDARLLEKECLSVFHDQDLLVQVRRITNQNQNRASMSAYSYLLAAMKAQFAVGNARLAKHFSFSTAAWHIRQLAGFGFSMLKLVNQKHHKKVTLESSRASKISAGHTSMWRQASLESSRLHLFLEDDVKLVNASRLLELTKTLLNFGTTNTEFICDCTHSYSLEEIGVDIKFSNLNENLAGFIQSFDFPFTNTLAANFLSPELLSHTVSALDQRRGRFGLGIDLDLLYLWRTQGINCKGCISAYPIFQQQSGFRDQKL